MKIPLKITQITWNVLIVIVTPNPHRVTVDKPLVIASALLFKQKLHIKVMATNSITIVHHVIILYMLNSPNYCSNELVKAFHY